MGRLGSTAFAAATLAVALGGAVPALAAPTTWQVDPANSKLGFHGTMSGEAFSGVFRRWTAQIAFDPKALAASKAAVWIDVASATTGDADRDQALPTPDWFSAKVFPKASFVTRGFKDLGGGRYQAVGDLTIRGAHKPIVLPFTLNITGDTARMNGAVQLNRLDFGLGQGRWKTADVVDPNVTVTVALTAHRAH
jgi:polyisoprenoid-binding protein YceI